MKSCALFAFITLFLTGSASATTLFTDLGSGFKSPFVPGSYILNSDGSFSAGSSAMEFTPSVSGTVDSLSAALKYSGFDATMTGMFSLFADNGGSLGADLADFTFTGIPASATVVTASSSSAAFLTAGTEYWLEVLHPSAPPLPTSGSNVNAVDWALAVDQTDVTDFLDFVTTNSGTTSITSVGQFPVAFTLDGTTPEPGTFVLFGSAIALLAGSRRWLSQK